AGIARRSENRPPVVPESEGLRHVAVDVDVAVAVCSRPPGDRVRKQGAPYLRSHEAVDVEVMGVLEHPHRAADDLVPFPGLPERMQFVWRVSVAPVESSGRWLRCGGELGVRCGGRRIRSRTPTEGEVAGQR